MLSSNNIEAQNLAVLNQNQQWFQYYNQIKLGNKITWLSDGGYRWSDAFENRSQYLIRTGIGYKIKPSVPLVTGVAHLGFYGAEVLSKLELRPYQEIDASFKLNNVSIKNRFRVEERYFYSLLPLENRCLSPVIYRLRYSATVIFPIIEFNVGEKVKKVSLGIGNEILVNVGNNSTHFFDQNRLMLSPSIHCNEHLEIAFTYDFMVSLAPEPFNLKALHIAWFQLKHHLDCSKGK